MILIEKQDGFNKNNENKYNTIKIKHVCLVVCYNIL